jgi:hypothetical protein
MIDNALVFWLIHDGYIHDDNPELIYVPKVVHPNFNEDLLSNGEGRLQSVWPRDISFYITGDQPVDLLLCTPRIDLISNRAKEVVERINREDVEFLPVQVCNTNGKPFLKMSYWVINVLSVVDALDWNNSRWTKTSPPSRDAPMVYMDLIKPCIYANKIQSMDFFQIIVADKKSYEKYISKRLKKELQKSGCTIGMEFTPIKTI